VTGALVLAAVPLLLGATFMGLAADRLLGTYPLGLAVAVGLGAVLAASAVVRLTLARTEQLSPRVGDEETAE
jgi:F0F1-type ATP synthase assembly protein I